MKYLAILSLVILSSQNVFGQTFPKENVIGKWKLVTIVISEEMFFDISNIDSTRKNFIKQYKEKKYNSPWTFEDTTKVEVLFNKAIAEIEKMFIEFKKDKTYITNGFNKKEGSPEGIEQGTYEYDSKKMTLKMIESDKQTNTPIIKIILLTDATLSIMNLDNPRSPKLTYKRLK